jgi:arylformamidase
MIVSAVSSGATASGYAARMRYADLTMPLGPDTPVYPGDTHPELALSADFASHGYLEHSLRLGTHSGTHIDAPAHMLPGAAMLADFSVDRFIGRGVLIDARAGVDVEQLRDSTIRPGDVVLLWTGFSENLSGDYYGQVPQISADAVAQLASSGASMVGIDAGSVDAEPFPVHKTLLGAGVLLAENLVGLAQLVGLAFTVTALPLRLGVEAAPARVIAAITD